MDVLPRLIQVDRRSVEVRTPGDLLHGIDRLAVVRNDRLGDLVLSLPAVSALHRAYPHACLALVVRPDLVPLARMFACVDEVIEAPTDARGLRSMFEGLDVDLMVCISRDAAVARAAAGARVPNRVGTGYRLYSPLFTRSVGERRRAGERHEVEYALSFAHRSGAPAEEATFPIEVPPGNGNRVGDWLRSHRVVDPFVVLHPGTGGSCPGWPAGHYTELAALLEAGGARVVISIGPADSAIAEALDRTGGIPGSLPRFTGGLADLTVLLSRANLVISNSTGPLHLATALGTPTLGFFAPWPTCGAVRWGPYAANGWALQADSSGVTRWSRARRARSAQALMAGISPEVVVRCVQDLTRGRAPRI